MKEYRIRLVDREPLALVYKAVKTSTDRIYFMKTMFIPERSLESFKKVRHSFENLLVFRHPNIAQNITSFIDEKKLTFNILMEYHKNVSLDKVIGIYKRKGTKIPEATIVDIMSQILLGMNYLHKRGIKHENINLKNFLMFCGKKVKITGFGIPSALLREVVITKHDKSVNKLAFAYFTDDLLQRVNYDFADDIWYLGCIFYELCCFQPLNNSLWNCSNNFRKLIPETYSMEIRELIMSMLNINKESRPSCEVLLKNKIIRKHINIVNFEFRKTYGKHNTKVYEGDLVDCKREGRGTYKTRMGKKYEGKWKNNVQNGRGISYFRNGNKFEGKWKSGFKNGKGTFYFSNGNKYVAIWKNDKTVGDVEYYYFNGDVYKGEIKNHLRHGYGILYYIDGGEYQGKWMNNKKHGEGIQIYANGNCYYGLWKKDYRYGQGRFLIANGDIYEGMWKNDKISGKGSYFYVNGDKYIGDWKCNKRDGSGICYYANGNQYNGEWRNDKIMGKGTFYFTNNEIYKGEWLDYYMHGKGVYHFANGDVYNGSWSNNKMNGEGVYYYANGSRYKGIWIDNTRVGKGHFYADKDIGYVICPYSENNTYYKPFSINANKCNEREKNSKKDMKPFSSIDMWRSSMKRKKFNEEI